jgi:hypothetical protein
VIIAEREEIVILEASRAELGGAFQAIGALYQELGDRFELETGFGSDEGLQLAFAANGVLSGSVVSTVDPGSGRSRIAVFALSQSGWGESLRIGMSTSAARLLLRACAGALVHVDEPEFHTLTGVEVPEMRRLVETLEGLGLFE